MTRLRRWLGLAATLAALAAPGSLVLAGPAQAGTWSQASCVNPDGSAAPNEGWTTGTIQTPSFSDTSDLHCGPGTPMIAAMSAATPAQANSGTYLQYTPPAGSTLVGGTVNVDLDGEGYEAGSPSASGYASLYEPRLISDQSDTIKSCFYFEGPCGNPDEFAGTVTLPSDAGGDFYALAGCGSFSNPPGSCQNGGKDGDWSYAHIFSADFVLSSNESPQGAGFTGSALNRRVRGTGQLVFTASEPTGPGIYSVAVAIDGRTVWSGTPNQNGGECVAVGSGPGGLIFDHQQPCLLSEGVDVPVPTGGLPDGTHRLAVAVTDAADNSTTVLDQTITTSNPQHAPVPRNHRAVRARFVISWHWSGATTLLRQITAGDLPKHGHVTVACRGPRCPRLGAAATTARAAGLLRRLSGRRLHAGDRMFITVTAPRRIAERIELDIRNGRRPAARLLPR